MSFILSLNKNKKIRNKKCLYYIWLRFYIKIIIIKMKGRV